MRYVIACGGTGGHVFPGMATARALLASGHEVHLWLAGKAIEQKALNHWSGPVVTIETDWRKPASLSALLRLPFRILRSGYQCLRQLRRERPAALLAMGSRASLLPVAAARLLGIPVVLHEANALPGQAITLLSRLFRATVALGFAETAARLPGRTTRYVGFPLRDMTPAAPLPGLPPGSAPVVLVMGGSQSSVSVNELSCDALIRLHRAGRRLRVIHLAGGQQENDLRAAYREAGVPAVVFGFLQDMGAAYAAATVAISRAGAASCAELASFGVPAIYIPYPLAGDHQRYNALAMEKAGAAITRLQSSLSSSGLADRLKQLLADQTELARMRQAALQAATPQAADHLAALLIESGRAGTRP